jgi:hypothetical protein
VRFLERDEAILQGADAWNVGDSHQGVGDGVGRVCGDEVEAAGRLGGGLTEQVSVGDFFVGAKYVFRSHVFS